MIKYLTIVIISSLPLIEARYGFAFGYKVVNIPAYISMPLAFLGTFISIIITTFVLYNLLHHRTPPWLSALINKFIDKVRLKHKNKLENFAVLSLILFIAIPLPLSGSFTGMVIGYLVGLPRKTTILCACIGTALSLVIVFLTIESIDISSKFFVDFLQETSLTN